VTQLIHAITTDGVLARTLHARSSLHGAQTAGLAPAQLPPAMQVARVVSSRGSLMVAGTKLQAATSARSRRLFTEIDGR